MSGAGYTLDAGALIAVDRGDRRMAFLLGRAFERNARLSIPATVIAQVVRSPARQAMLMRLLRHPSVDIAAFDEVVAIRVGRLLAESATSDVVDAHVVNCAREAGQVVITSDPDDLRRLDPHLPLFAL